MRRALVPVLAFLVVTLCPVGAPGRADAASRRRTAPLKPTRQAERPRPRVLEAERRLDASGWDWRRAGVRVRVGFHPRDCCHWGVFDVPAKTVWLGPTAFASASRLNYVALHELAHAWQFSSGQLKRIVGDMAPWGHRGVAAIERQADCVAAVWGSRRGHYWTCPAEARQVVLRRLAGDWR